MYSLLWFLFIFATGDTFARNEKYICTLNHTVELEADKITFFESPNFPRSITTMERSECNINFTKTLLPGEINKKFVVSVTHKICNSDYCPEVHLALTNASSYFFTFLHNDDFYDTLAFQGYAYVDDWADACPFESISRIDPFEFTDVSQIITLKSVYTQEKARRQPCLWQFKAPHGYGFKVVITSLNISDSTVFKIQNSHDLIIKQDNQTKARITYPYYTTDNYLQIFLSENLNSYWPESGRFHSFFHHHFAEFTGYLTIVKNNFDEVLIDCEITKNQSHIFWSYTNPFGYPNQAKCSYILTISPNTEVIIGGKRNRLEPGVDFISFYDLNNSMEVIHEQPNDEKTQDEIVLTPGDGNSERAILCEFKSDGSVVSQGFEMDFEIINCTCANPNIIVSCSSDVTSVNLMNQHQDYFKDYYCGNLNCNYTFKLESSCTKQFIVLNFNFDYNPIDPNRIEFDVFKVFTNNKNLFTMNYMTWGQHLSIIIPENNQNIFQAITVPSKRPKLLTLDFSALDLAIILPTIILNSTKPYFYHDHRSDPEARPNLMQIELSYELKMKNATIDIYLFELINLNVAIQFYTDTTLMYPLILENCFVDVLSYTYKCKMYLQSFVLIQKGTSTNFFVQATVDDIPINADGCMFKHNNIANLVLGKNGEAASYTAMANDKSSCKIFFYNYDQKIRIKNIFTNPNANGTINIFIGNTEKLLVSIDTQKASDWRDIYAYFYLIEIPVNTTIMVTCYEFSESINSFLNISTYPYIGVVTTPYFGDDFGEDYDSPAIAAMLTHYGVYNFDIKFTLLEIDVSAQNYFYFIHNGTHFNISSNFHSMIFPSGEIEIWYSCNSSVHCLIRLMLETVDSTSTNTVPPHFTTPKITASNSPPLFVTTQQSRSSFISINFYLIMLIQSFKIFV